MRKSERIRQLEFAVLKLEFHIELMEQYLTSVMETLSLERPDLDAGKWYQKRTDKNS